MPNWTRKNFSALRDVSSPDVPIQWRFARTALEWPEVGVSRFEAGPDGLDVICIGGRRPDGPDSERYPDFWN